MKLQADFRGAFPAVCAERFRFLREIKKTYLLHCIICPVLHPLLYAPTHILRYGQRLVLRHHAEQGYERFSFGLVGVNVVFLEVNGYSELLQFPNRFETVFCITSESRYGFYYNSIELVFAGIVHHAVELITLIRAGTGDASCA